MINQEMYICLSLTGSKRNYSLGRLLFLVNYCYHEHDYFAAEDFENRIVHSVRNCLMVFVDEMFPRIFSLGTVDMNFLYFLIHH